MIYWYFYSAIFLSLWSLHVSTAAVTWITHCCFLNLLTFDEFERVMRAVKKYFGNNEMLGNSVLKLRTNMHLIVDDPWR